MVCAEGVGSGLEAAHAASKAEQMSPAIPKDKRPRNGSRRRKATVFIIDVVGPQFFAVAGWVGSSRIF